MTHPNVQVVRDGFAAFAAQDMDALRGLFAPDAVWHASGRSQLSGVFKGVEEILDLFRRTMELSDGTFAIDVHAIVGDDEHVFAAYGVSARRRGKSLRDSAVLVLHVRDGKVSEVWGTTGDQYLVDDFWS